MKPVELKEDIFWVGAIDWAVRDFHGYETPRGTTYNNYLIKDEEVTLVDTVKYDFSDITIKHIKKFGRSSENQAYHNQSHRKRSCHRVSIQSWPELQTPQSI